VFLVHARTNSRKRVILTSDSLDALKTKIKDLFQEESNVREILCEEVTLDTDADVKQLREGDILNVRFEEQN
jgi:hypothetical protein